MKTKFVELIEFGLILALGIYTWLLLSTLLKLSLLFIIDNFFELNSATFEGGLLSMLSAGVVLFGGVMIICNEK